MNPVRRRRTATRIAALILTPALGLGGAVATDLVTGSTAAHAAVASSYGGPISRSEVLARARNWFARRYDSDLQYTHTDEKATDIDGDHKYRRDCSGLVDMAWHMDSQPNTWQLEGSSQLQSERWSDLQPGDALIDDVDGDDHAVLFEGWLDDAKTQFQYYSFGDTPMLHYPYGNHPAGSRDGTLGIHPASRYTAYHYQSPHIQDTDPGVGAVQFGSSTHVFMRGTDGSLWQFYWDGTTWNQHNLGGQIIGSPAAIYDPVAGAIRVFIQGTDHALWQFFWNTDGWHEQRIGGQLTSGVGATMDHGVIRTFFRGGDGQLWQYYWNGVKWTMQKIGGYILDNPAVEADGSIVRVFAQGTDGAMWQFYYDGDSWHTQSIGGEFVSGFGSYLQGGVTHVFGRGTDDAMWQYYWDGSNWHLQSVGGKITSGTAAVYNGSQGLVFARGGDGSLWQYTWDGSTWQRSLVGGQLA